MKGLLENHALFLSVFLCIAGVCACAWEMNPWANKMIHLVPFPDDGVRLRVLGPFSSALGTFIWDRLVTAIPQNSGAMMRQAAATTLADLAPIFSTMFKVALGLLIFARGILSSGSAPCGTGGEGQTPQSSRAGAAAEGAK